MTTTPWEETVLENDIVRMRPIRPEDEEGYAKIVFDPETWSYFLFRVDTAADLASFMKTSLEVTRARERICFTIFEKRTGQIAGSMSFGNNSPRDKRIEIGWSWLGKPFRGSGMNRWSKLALLTHAFDVMDYERVEFKTDVLNQGARRGLIKIGAVEEGTLRSHTLMPSGRRRDTIYYSILRGEWPAVKRALRGE